MTAAELEELWVANRLDPWPEDRLDILFAELCNLICKVNGVKRTSFDMWLPKWDAEPKSKQAHMDGMQAQMIAAAKAMNKR